MLDIMKDFILSGLKCIALGILNSSYYICLFTSLLGIILYVAGCKKAGKYVSVSLILYVFSECLRSLLA